MWWSCKDRVVCELALLRPASHESAVPRTTSIALPSTVQHQGRDALWQVCVDLHPAHVFWNFEDHGVVEPIELIPLVSSQITCVDADGLFMHRQTAISCLLAPMLLQHLVPSAVKLRMVLNFTRNGSIYITDASCPPPNEADNASNRTDTPCPPQKNEVIAFLQASTPPSEAVNGANSNYATVHPPGKLIMVLNAVMGMAYHTFTSVHPPVKL